MKPNRLVAVSLAFALVGAACSGSDGSDETGSGVVVSSTTAPAAVPEEEPAASEPDAPERSALENERQLSPLADQVRSVGDIRYDPTAAVPDPGPRPVGLTIDGIDVFDAPIRDVGVEPNGEMEIPGATEVGWYRWSPTPGRDGSAVLAAHIAFNGRDGVFRNLDDLEVGERFTVHYDDGSEQEFEITEKGQYDKEELPFDRVFSKTGDPSVVLITCGGDFNRGLNSYEDNVVAYADPV